MSVAQGQDHLVSFFRALSQRYVLETFLFYFLLQTFNAARASFLPENEKQELIEQLKIVHGIY